jgi:hypothetical protein
LLVPTMPLSVPMAGGSMSVIAPCMARRSPDCSVCQSPVRLGWQHPRDRKWSSPARPLLVRKSNSGFLLACSCVASLAQLWNDRANEFLLLRERWLWYTSTQSIHLERREAWSADPGAFACTRIRVCARASPGSSEPHHTLAAPIEQLLPTDVLHASRLPTRRSL